MRVFTTGAVAKIIGCAPKTVNDWIDCGMMAGFRLPLPRARPNGPPPKGAHDGDRRVAENDLIDFANRYGIRHVAAALGGSLCTLYGFGPKDAADVAFAVPLYLHVRPQLVADSFLLGSLAHQTAVAVFGPLALQSAPELFHAAAPSVPAVVVPGAEFCRRPWMNATRPGATPQEVAAAVEAALGEPPVRLVTPADLGPKKRKVAV